MKATILKTVLLVDDEKIFREAVAEVMELSGYRVLLAPNGSKAIDLLRMEQVDLLLLDLNMPVMNGWHTFRQVAALNPTLPVVIVTARSNLRDTVMSCGADALLEKPVDMDELLAVVTRLTSPLEPDHPVKRRRQERRLEFVRKRSIAGNESALND